MLRRDDPNSCVVLSADHTIYTTRRKLQLLCIAVLLYRILAIQQTQLPDDAVQLGDELEFTSSTTSTDIEGSVIKLVDLEKQRYLIDQLAALQQLYRATKASKHLIWSEDGPRKRNKYTVTASPFGEQLRSGSAALKITSLAQLQAAISCILLALKNHHVVTFAHTDIHRPKVINAAMPSFA